jgi:hypothetical protein
MFSLVILIFGFLTLQNDPGVAGGFWFIFGLATFAVGYGWSRFAGWLSIKLAQPNTALLTDASPSALRASSGAAKRER